MVLLQEIECHLYKRVGNEKQAIERAEEISYTLHQHKHHSACYAQLSGRKLCLANVTAHHKHSHALDGVWFAPAGRKHAKEAWLMRGHAASTA
ncbi:hypothetical protein MRB53_039301 [Persea americana]|nr:hypothetical protein MRB53_039301 [Persea americana]